MWKDSCGDEVLLDARGVVREERRDALCRGAYLDIMIPSNIARVSLKSAATVLLTMICHLGNLGQRCCKLT